MMTIELGQGGIHPGQQGNPEDGQRGALCCCVQEGRLVLPRVGWNSGLGPRGQMGIFSDPPAEFLVS